MISICIPTYNGEQYLEQCLNSAIAQTYRDVEIVICDDCSTDNTWNIIQAYAAKHPQVRAIKNEKNLGLVGNWNNCIKQAKGEWIKFLFQDDSLSEKCIESLATSISETDKMIVIKRKYIFDEKMTSATKDYYEKRIKTLENSGFKTDAATFIEPGKVSSIAAENICLNFIGEPTFVMFKKDIISEVGYFNADLIQICDLEYFLRIGTIYGIKYLPETLAYFTIHEKSASAQNAASRLFTVRYLEPVITVHQLLFGPVFNEFRSALSRNHIKKLKTYFKVHVYEYARALKGAEDKEIERFRELIKVYPKVDKYKNGSAITVLVFWVLRFKRMIKSN